ncbi:hypothetical protein QQS21_006940 [Conoideocrella luteorostrata]|uniref:Uncharacterized protein n=1 Tax=Conoideocrella luteorostrata TaxID=1105319 RepID=A0AAJ0CLM5_9HYPO|nr:hypothetical protein QQS21_006940 [Conoideocrella luteorostrata]
MTVRWDLADSKSTFENFDPKLAGRMDFNFAIIDNMIETRDNAGYYTFVFQMAISAAHEICHFLTGFFTGSAQPSTPPIAGVPSSGPRQIGEAKHYWEREAFGGLVEFYANPEDKKNHRQAGIPNIFEDSTSRSPDKRVPLSLIENYRIGLFRFPISVSCTEETRRSTIRRQTSEMSALRDNWLAAQPDAEYCHQDSDVIL